MKRIALTPGEPAGIGPDLAIMLAQQSRDAELVVVTDADVLRQRSQQLGLPLEILPFDPGQDSQIQAAGQLVVHHIPVATKVIPGQLDPRNAKHVIQTLDAALALCNQGTCAGWVTGPVHKGVINDAGYAFTGHTEYLAQKTGVAEAVMMLYAPGLRVALATTHLALREVPAALSVERLARVMRVLHTDLQSRFGLALPRILVTGLNPHAGEGGHLGREEIDLIAPAIQRCRGEGLEVSGPLAADTAFTPKYLESADVVLTMYHDQGLPVLKHMGFGHIVNITLGLPILRTSVDHGTALSLAGTGNADLSSLRCAVEAAIHLSSTGRACA